MKKIYHNYLVMEDWKNGFYNSPGSEKTELIKKAIELLSDNNKTEHYMNKVIFEWKYSCEHNLSNTAMNRIAYLGQAACCIYAKIPSTVTMEAWSLVSQENRDRANEIANCIIKKWEQHYAENQTRS